MCANVNEYHLGVPKLPYGSVDDIAASVYNMLTENSNFISFLLHTNK